MRLIEFQKSIKTNADLEFYNILIDATKNYSSVYESRFMALQLYKGTLYNAYRNNAPGNYINFMAHNLDNMLEDSLGGVAVMTMFAYVLDNNFSYGDKISMNEGVEVTSKTLQYLLDQIGKYDYISFMVKLSAKMQLSNDFKNEIVDYFMENSYSVRSNLNQLNRMKTDLSAINEWMNSAK